MPTMNAAQVRALSVEDMMRFDELQLDANQLNQYGLRRSCEIFTRPEISTHYYIEMAAVRDVTTADLIMWLMALRELEGRVGQEAKLCVNDDGVEASFKFSRPTTLEERATAQAWLDANPPQPVKWRAPVRFASASAAYDAGYYGRRNDFVLYDEVVPDAPPPADVAGI